jgi:hypothetical protein
VLFCLAEKESWRYKGRGRDLKRNDKI